MPLLRHHAVSSSIEEVNYQPDNQPAYESVPVLRRQGEHQQQTCQDPEDWNQWNERRPEWAVRIWISPPHYDDCAADNHECEERSDTRHFRQYAQRNEASHRSDEKAR